jgi:hypothetical protein
MTWQAICDNPFLRDLPFKIETNEWGQIVTSPASNRHGWLQVEIARLLLRTRVAGCLSNARSRPPRA